MTPFEKAVDYFDGSPTKLARALGVTPQSVNNWRHRGLPASHALTLEVITGGKLKAIDLSERRVAHA